MKQAFNRRKFIKSAAVAGIGISLVDNFLFSTAYASNHIITNGRIGIIGLDTSHSVAFTKSLNSATARPEFEGYKVVAAYPYGSKTIASSSERIPGYIEDVKTLGVEITESVGELLKKVDAVLLETNDGTLHLDQALEVFKSGKRVFIDKPAAASLKDVVAIYAAAKKYKVPVFSSSSVRYSQGAQEIANGKIGKVTGADTYSPFKLEKSHADLYWYGIHGVESLYTVMGTGCKTVVRVHTDETEVVVGTWNDDRIGSVRCIHNGKNYGGTAFGSKGIAQLGYSGGYDSLLVKIIEFFKTGVSPVTEEETLEIYAFMEAADESKRLGGVPVNVSDVMKKAVASSNSAKALR
jgi:predicted dehydrogenase